MKKYQTLLPLNILLLLLISIPNQSHAITNVASDSTNILLLSSNSKFRNILKISSYAFEKGDDVAIKTYNKTKIKGIITKIENDKIYILTENETIEKVDIHELKTIKRYKERHPFFGAIAMGFGVLLCLFGLIGIVFFISVLSNNDVGGILFPLAEALIVSLILFLGYRLLKSSEKRRSPRKTFRIGKKWHAEIRGSNK